MQFGDKIIFDCSYDQYMTKREANSAAKQLVISFAENRQHKDPFDLHFCNVNFNGDTFSRMQRHIPNLRSPEFPTNLCEGSYLDLFPKENLVYLTPHCRNDLTEYDPDSIYIIGAMVDTTNHEPLSLIKAKELNLKIARLPLDRYLDWGSNSGKTLTLDQMMKIMLGLKTSRSWDCALKHVPRRKIVNEELNERKEVTKWNANVNKFKKVYRREERNFDFDSSSVRATNDQSRLSTAEKFKKTISRDTEFGRNIRTEKPNFERNFKRFDSNMSTADKFKKQDLIGGKSTKTSIDYKELFSK